jgi:hypothetical protein
MGTFYIDTSLSTWLLQSTHPNIKRQQIRPTGDEVERLIRQPMGPAVPQSLHDVLVEGLVAVCKAKPTGLDAVRWLGEWLLVNNPNKPRVQDPDDQ